MRRIAFKMRLFPGKEEEYKERHDNIWPALSELLRTSGIHDYSIFLDRQTGTLFGIMNSENQSSLDKLPSERIMKEWWAYMKDIMDCNPDNSPATTYLEEVFYMP
jgi:L-rhamnose mutarotase